MLKCRLFRSPTLTTENTENCAWISEQKGLYLAPLLPQMYGERALKAWHFQQSPHGPVWCEIRKLKGNRNSHILVPWITSVAPWSIVSLSHDTAPRGPESPDCRASSRHLEIFTDQRRCWPHSWCYDARGCPHLKVTWVRSPGPSSLPVSR